MSSFYYFFVMVFKCLHCRKRFLKDKYHTTPEDITSIQIKFTLCEYCVEHPNSKRFFDNSYSHRKNFLKNPTKQILREQNIRKQLLNNFKQQ